MNLNSKTTPVIISIDDSPITLRMTALMIKNLGDEVISVQVDKETSISMIIAQIQAVLTKGIKIHFILTDVQMPISMEKMAEKIHQMWPELFIVALTSAEQEAIDCLDQTHLLTVIKRPFNLSALNEIKSKMALLDQVSNTSSMKKLMKK